MVQDRILPPEERVSREIILEESTKPLDLAEVFGNDNPVEFEIGIGKGLFLMHSALQNPDRNYMGIEIRRKYLVKAKERAEKRPLENIRFITGEAFSFMEEYLAPESLSVIHIYYPDPWPKKRHHKRRLLSPEFMALVDRTLKPGGLLLIATDHKDYWEWMNEVLDNQSYLQPCEKLPEAREGTDGLTNYEIKYVAEGRELYSCGYQKK